MENQSTFYSTPTPSILNMYNPDQEASKGFVMVTGKADLVVKNHGGAAVLRIRVPLRQASVCGVP